MTLSGEKATAIFRIEKPLTVSFCDPTKTWESEFSKEFFILS